MTSFLAIEALAGVQPGWSPQRLALMLLWATGGQVALLPTGMTYPYPPVSLLPPSAASAGDLPRLTSPRRLVVIRPCANVRHRLRFPLAQPHTKFCRHPLQQLFHQHLLDNTWHRITLGQPLASKVSQPVCKPRVCLLLPLPRRTEALPVGSSHTSYRRSIAFLTSW